MWKLNHKILYLLYLIFAANLPYSRRSAWAKSVRGFFAKHIVRHFGHDANIEKNAYFTPGLSIGDYSSIGPRSEIFGVVTIGNDVMMGPDVVIQTNNHKHDRTDIPMRLQGFEEPREVVIGDDVWIGQRVIILPGVTVGKGCIIAAGAVVTKDVPEYSVVAGVPARVVKSRLSEGTVTKE